MKPPIQLSAWAAACLLTWMGMPALKGQSPVTSFFASYTTTASTVGSYSALPASPGTFSGCSSTHYTFTFSNGVSNQYKLISFNAAGNSWFVSPAAASTVRLRRVNNANATGNRSIIYMESTFPAATACPSPAILSFVNPYQDVMENVLNAGMLNQGTDNVFTNAANGDGNNNNIERVDICFPSGLNTASPSQAGFAIFDRGGNYQHDPFKIVAITGLDANGDPSSFGAVKKCTGGNGSNSNGNYGHPSAADGNRSFSAYVMRKEAAEPWLRPSSNVNQEVGGVFYTFADLGITPGQPLYGYALLGPDGSSNPGSAQLLNINDNSVYPTNTTEAAGGGLDLVAVNSVFTTGSYVVLPLQIGAFTGNIRNGQASLQWKLENVQGGERVALERSADMGAMFVPIYESQPAPANAAAPGDSYIDQGLVQGKIYYYRLKITLPTGQVQYSLTVSLHGEATGTGWKIAPTLADRSQSLNLEGPADGVYTVLFYGLSGNALKVNVLVSNGKGRIDPPAGGLARGIYWLVLSGKDGPLAGGTKVFIR